jgi:hypothetical protein
MADPRLYSLLADVVLVAHFLFVSFVVGGLLARLAGLAAGWAWVRSALFRRAHLGAVAIVVIQAWFGLICPLTRWESALRARAGQAPYDETFIQFWLHRALFYQAEPWVFTLVYTVFGAAVLAAWLPGWRR